MVSKGMVKHFLETNPDLANKTSEIVPRMDSLKIVFEAENLEKILGDSSLIVRFWEQWETDHEMKHIALQEAGYPV